ncbi:AsnC family transcriptional regulator [Desulfospira joergensenii]|uniref:siroheme decarboxylase subunit alpha n=1 Tax=Desulfospira joergensenii TaxID=53329 RepID=UPI0003B780E8|nr:AsnC family transcriptional regulator [Desulfospira joergensenii]
MSLKNSPPSPIDEADKRILNTIQTDFPIDARPYRILADRLNMNEDQLIKRIKALKDEGIIRRIGGNFSPDRLGYYSTLCAAKVDPEKVDLFTRTVNAYSGVTHNYQRDHSFNIWFTFIAPSREMIQESLEEISRKTGVDTILNLPATRLFKISANFRL